MENEVPTNEPNLPRLERDDLRHICNGIDYRLPAEMVEKIKLEGFQDDSWDMVGEWPSIEDQKQRALVGQRKVVCPMCGFDQLKPVGAKVVYIEVRGCKTGVRLRKAFPCRCIYYDHFYRLWSKIPPLYRNASLRTLKVPDLVPAQYQHLVKDLIKKVKNQPNSNFTILGPGGYGKTTIAYALLQEACVLRAWEIFRHPNLAASPPSIWDISANTFFEEHHKETMGYNIQGTDDQGMEVRSTPKVTVEAIKAARKAGFTPFLLIEELDKITSLSDFKYKTLFAVVSAIHENEGQLVITSNLTGQELENLVAGSNASKRGNSLFNRLSSNRNLPENGRPTVLVSLFPKPDKNSLVTTIQEPDGTITELPCFNGKNAGYAPKGRFRLKRAEGKN